MIVPALRAIGCLKFDAICISHPHLDHFSAIPEIVDAFHVDRVYATEAFVKMNNEQFAPGAFMSDLQTKGLTITTLITGDTICFDGFVWSVLHPQTGYQSRIVNDGSLTFQIKPETLFQNSRTPKSLPEVAWLTLCGDAQTEAIARIISSPIVCPSLVMELPHHGAWSDGIGELIKKLNPEILIQSTGFQRFRFDKIRSVVENRIRGVTCRDGALRVTWFADDLENRIINRILLERWSGGGWVPTECRTYQK